MSLVKFIPVPQQEMRWFTSKVSSPTAEDDVLQLSVIRAEAGGAGGCEQTISGKAALAKGLAISADTIGSS